MSWLTDVYSACKSISTLTTEFIINIAENLCPRLFTNWFSKARQPYTSLICNVSQSGVKYVATGLWSSENVFFGIINDDSLSDSLIDQVPTTQFGLGPYF